jgi:hypothetical protein
MYQQYIYDGDRSSSFWRLELPLADVDNSDVLMTVTPRLYAETKTNLWQWVRRGLMFKSLTDCLGYGARLYSPPSQVQALIN